MATSYSNTGGSGDRSAVITTTLTNATPGAGLVTDLVDGALTDEFWWLFGTANAVVKFDFGVGNLWVIDEFKWLQSTAAGHGTWNFEGSNDNAAWDVLRADLTLGGATSTTYAISNNTAYRYYRLAPGTAQLTNSNPFLREIEFKIGTATPTNSALSEWWFFQ